MEMMGLDSDVLEQLYKLCSTRLCSNTLGQVHRRIGREGDGGGEGRGGGGRKGAAIEVPGGEEYLISHVHGYSLQLALFIHCLQYLSSTYLNNRV